MIKRFFSLFAMLAVVFTPLFAYADGFIVVHRPRRVPPQKWNHFPLSVKYHRVHTTIKNQVAVTKIDQVFFNPNRRQLEGTYIFPLPERATLKQFSMYMNGKEMQGELLDRDKARKIYEGIVRKMKDPALLEYMGRGMFKCRVFPIPARGTTRIKLSYTEVLTSDANLVEYTYPLNTEKFSSKPLEEVTITVDVASKLPIKTIYSPTHQIDVIRQSPTRAKIGFERKNVKPNKDFKLYFSQTAKDISLDLISTLPSARKKGYFLMVISPQSDLKKSQAMAKDIAFVVDTSGSMMGDKMEQAKRALKYCVQSLGTKDRFAIVDFSTEARSMSEKLLDADEAGKKEALTYIKDMNARGGTNIHEALTKALNMAPKNSKRPFLVCFMTDGEPTVGEIDPQKIVKDVTKANQTNARIFVLGVGHDLNTKLLDRMADKNNGARTYITEGENIEVKVSSFYNKIAFPALSNVKLTYGKNIRVNHVYPKNLPDLFVGGQLKVMGRYKGHGPTAITLTGIKNGKEVKLVFEPKFAKKSTNEEVPALWANRKIAFLLDQIRLHGEKKELKEEIVRLAKKFGIVTPYTSYLVTEDERRRPRRTAGRWNRGRNQAFGGGGANNPAPNSPRADAAKKMEEAKKGLKQSTGKSAVEGSRELQKYKDKSNIESLGGQSQIKRIAGKTFYNIDGTWVDSTYDEKAKLAKVEVKPFSAEYFKLIQKNKTLARFLSLGKKVIVVHDDKVYMVK